MTLSERHRNVRSREEFIQFVKAMSDDLRDNADSWQNMTLERYIEAIGSWTQDMDGYYKNQGLPIPDDPNWKVFSDILMAARIYE
jgi:hypothetical protein